eukprot:gene39892-63681_t
MCQYLAERYNQGGLNVQANDPNFGAYLNWLHMSDATLTFPQTLVLRYTYFEPPERLQPQIASDYSRWFLARLRAVDLTVQESDYLCAGRFTAADVAVGYALVLATHLGLNTQFPAAVVAYWQRLQNRPAFQNALRVEREAAADQGVDPTPSPELRHRNRHQPICRLMADFCRSSD